MNRFARSTFVVLLALLAGSACSEFAVKNKPPIALAKAVVGGTPVADLTKPIDSTDGGPVAVTLDGRGSFDPDGSIKSALWLRTDVPPTVRFAGNKMVDDGSGTAFMGDPPAGNPAPTMMLPIGKHKFSLWVTDNDGRVSKPATLKFEVKMASNYHPDPACMAAYGMVNANAACVECVCSPMAPMGGCLELYQNCYKNTDSMFGTLCGGVITCAIAGKCVGSMCYAAAPLCMTQIDAAATYMGGTLGNCSMGEMGSNPCRGANLLGACTNYDAMMMDGPCRSACK